MTRVLLGMMLGIALVAVAAGSYVRARDLDTCLGRCGEGTRCQDFHCVVSGVAIPTAPPVKAPRSRRKSAASDPLGAAPENTLKPGDDKMVAQGDALGRPEKIDLTEPGDDGRELSQEEIDRVLHARDSAITKCITTTLGDAPLETGKVEVGLRIEKGGEVSRVRVEGPALLQRNGLGACIKKVVSALRFPRSGGAAVVTYPFELK